MAIPVARGNRTCEVISPGSLSLSWNLAKVTGTKIKSNKVRVEQRNIEVRYHNKGYWLMSRQITTAHYTCLSTLGPTLFRLTKFTTFVVN